jgi:hypothetical protein
MTLEEAVVILNERRHHGHSNWYISVGYQNDNLVFGKDEYEFFEPFEAVAIAEKYASQLKEGSLRSPQPDL